MPTVEFSEQEVQSLMTILVKQPLPWEVTNPLLVKISRAMQPTTPAPQPAVTANSGKEKKDVQHSAM